VTLFYDGSDKKVIVVPFRFLPALRFPFSIDNSIVKTPTGQRVDQAGMEYFVRFLLKNLKSVPQKEHECQEDEERITFLLFALDHIEEKSVEKYRITISKRDWLPVRLERFTQEGGLMEIAVFKDYAINRQLEDTLFSP
jgi:outer membrane lipoprotein-sorting protein